MQPNAFHRITIHGRTCFQTQCCYQNRTLFFWLFIAKWPRTCRSRKILNKWIYACGLFKNSIRQLQVTNSENTFKAPHCFRGIFSISELAGISPFAVLRPGFHFLFVMGLRKFNPFVTSSYLSNMAWNSNLGTRLWDLIQVDKWDSKKHHGIVEWKWIEWQILN